MITPSKTCARCGAAVVSEDSRGNLTTISHDCPALQPAPQPAIKWISIHGRRAHVFVLGSLWNYYELQDRVSPSTCIGVWLERFDGTSTWCVEPPVTTAVPPTLARILAEAVKREEIRIDVDAAFGGDVDREGNDLMNGRG
jgi:hypothetical protein